VVNISGVPVTTNTTLQTGWNLIGVPAAVNNMATYAATLGASEVWGYSNGNWCSYNRNIPVQLNCLTTMQPETGYYVKMP